MNHILYLNTSLSGEQSRTRQMLEHLRRHWASKFPHATHHVRDLATQPLPHLDARQLGEPHDECVRALAELKACDVVVIAAPMYNFGVSSTLKAWVDHVLKAGETFRYSDQGPQGLLTGKRAVLLVSTGGVYSGGPYQAFDFVEPYLRTVLGFIGITDVVTVRAEAAALGQPGHDNLRKALEILEAL